MRKQFTLLYRKLDQHRKKRGYFHSWRRVSPKGMLALCSAGLMVLLCACSNPFFTPTKSGPATPQTFASPTSAVIQSPTPTPRTITTHISSNCSSTVASYKWDSLLGTKAGVNKVQLVTCGSMEGAGSLEAVVGVGYYTPDARLDVYVFDNLGGTPTQTFKLTGLIDGDAQISPAGTLDTAEVGPKSTILGVPDLFKEYQWNHSTFAQVLFPFIYPDMTHYQAEADNAIVIAQLAAKQNANAWKISCTAESGHLANDVFHWLNTTATVQKFLQPTDTVIVQLTNLGTGGGGFISTCHHLDGNTNNVLEIASVTPLDTNTTISNPASGAQLTSPVTVTGVGQAGKSILGEVVLYDDTFLKVGNSGPIGGSGYVNFSNVIRYNLNASGVQEGVVVLMTTTQDNIAQTNQVMMIKVFLSA